MYSSPLSFYQQTRVTIGSRGWLAFEGSGHGGSNGTHEASLSSGGCGGVMAVVAAIVAAVFQRHVVPGEIP